MSTCCFVSGWSSHGTRVLLTIPSIIVIYFIALLYDCQANKQINGYRDVIPRNGWYVMLCYVMLCYLISELKPLFS